MAVESDADRAVFLSSADFGISATWNSTSFDVLFLNSYELLTIFEIQIEASNVSAYVKDSDISGLARGETVSINSVAYKVRDIQPDGTGMTILVLSKD